MIECNSLSRVSAALVIGVLLISTASAPARAADPPKKYKASAILIEAVDGGDAGIPAEFRMAIYEYLVSEVRKSGLFPKVYRSGDHAADGVADLVTLRTRVERFQEGSQMKRETVKVFGATKVDITAKVSNREGTAYVDQKIQGKVRFFGENLNATHDVAKRVTKLLRQNF